MDKIQQKDLEKDILETAIRTGQMIKHNAYDLKTIEWKHEDDPVTNLDKEAEQYIKKSLRKYVPNFCGEEYGKENYGSDITILIDPIDGTKSFMRKEFNSSVSIAAEKNNEVFFGVVYDFMKNTAYYANDTGAYLLLTDQFKTIKMPISYPKLSRHTISIDNAPEVYEKLKKNNSYSMREPNGSIALNMALLAQGSYEGLIMKMKKVDVEDIAAGCYIMKQAGVCMKNFSAEEFDYSRHKDLIALKPDIANKVLKILRRD